MGNKKTLNRGGQSSDRLTMRYRFDDQDMDLFFVIACGWGRAGGLDIGEAFYVAESIEDGDARSWVKSFEQFGQNLEELAERWREAGWMFQAAQSSLKAFASYRSAWQFAALGTEFERLYARHQSNFRKAIDGLGIQATFFDVPFRDKALPGLYLQNEQKDAPVILIVGGADTCFEEIFLSFGRHVLEHGYSVAMVDLPGQGLTMQQGLHWEVATELPISAVVDELVQRFNAVPGRIGLLGYSLGGYFAARAAGFETRFGAVVASTPLPNVGIGFPGLVKRWLREESAGQLSSATKRNIEVMYWKMGASSPDEFIEKARGMIADPGIVDVPFLSIVGSGEGEGFKSDARAWHENIRSERKKFVELDAATGADGHCQAANRLRLVQEMCGWLNTIFGQR